MEAPEKLYVDTGDNLSDSIFYGFTEKRKDDDIEYVRKDTFIEKTVEHINGLIEFLNEYGHQLKKERIIEDFKKYIKKGE